MVVVTAAVRSGKKDSPAEARLPSVGVTADVSLEAGRQMEEMLREEAARATERRRRWDEEYQKRDAETSKRQREQDRQFAQLSMAAELRRVQVAREQQQMQDHAEFLRKKDYEAEEQRRMRAIEKQLNDHLREQQRKEEIGKLRDQVWQIRRSYIIRRAQGEKLPVEVENWLQCRDWWPAEKDSITHSLHRMAEEATKQLSK